MSIDEIIDRNLFRKDVYDLIPDNSENILDFGCNEGELLLRLKRDKGCKGLYGVELRENCQDSLKKYLDGSWNINIEEDGACLGQDYKAFFKYIVMHDVIEHLYDPWYSLMTLRQYLADDGRLIIVTPNFQFWGLWRSAMLGSFSYGGTGGLMNEEHIRWFSSKTLVEALLLSGYSVRQQLLFFPEGTDISNIDKSQPIHEFELPPAQCKLPFEVDKIKVNFEKDIRADYEFLLANKILMVAQKSNYEPQMDRVCFTSLKKTRDNYSKWRSGQL